MLDRRNRVQFPIAGDGAAIDGEIWKVVARENLHSEPIGRPWLSLRSLVAVAIRKDLPG